jgi:hypothetical protein
MIGSAEHLLPLFILKILNSTLTPSFYDNYDSASSCPHSVPLGRRPCFHGKDSLCQCSKASPCGHTACHGDACIFRLCSAVCDCSTMCPACCGNTGHPDFHKTLCSHSSSYHIDYLCHTGGPSHTSIQCNTFPHLHRTSSTRLYIAQHGRKGRFHTCRLHNSFLPSHHRRLKVTTVPSWNGHRLALAWEQVLAQEERKVREQGTGFQVRNHQTSLRGWFANHST